MNDSEAGASGSAMEEFDVFLNHRGPDVKATFVAHLEDALECAGFRPFLDAKSLRKSNPALQSIDQALAMAKVHVAVVSRGYAESEYCLNELVAMMRSGKPVVPVLYGVEPEDLRWVENGPFAEAFEKHKVRGRSEREVQEWRDALEQLAELTAFRLADYKSDEARLKREVVNEVARLIPSNRPIVVDEYRVGLEGPTHACIEFLRSIGDGVGLLGLVGMGGVGKSTLAREIYNQYAGTSEFRFMTFLEIHRDFSSSDVQVRSIWHRSLREQLLWDLLRTHDNGSSYGTLFQRVSTLGPVFIVIDDIHNLGQFQELVPSLGVLCPGSCIIITSRDRSVVNNFIDRVNAHYIHEVSEMGVEDANVLFNLHAFHSEDAPMYFKDIAKSIVEACGGLPLALKVMGSSLFDKRSDGDRETIWVEATDALWASEDVMGVLRWSYERLNKSEKLMFMDITCLFDGHSIEEAFVYWESCKHSGPYIGLCKPNTSLRNLINKNLVDPKTNGLRRFMVHGLLRELGQWIAMNAKRHLTKDGFLVDEDKVGTIGLNLVGCRKRKFKAEDFGNMSNLHVLRLPDACKLDGDFGCMSKKLRIFQWSSMPLERLPGGFSLSLLTSLDLSYSTKLACIWTESNGRQESFPNLHSLKLTRCYSITRLPDSLGQSLQLQYLDLDSCRSLEKLPNSIGQLKALKELNLSYCTNLKTLPDSIACIELIRLSMDGCTSITKLPEFLGQFLHLFALDLQDCQNLRTIPYSIGQLKGLQVLYISRCRSLKTLPNSLGALSNLEVLYATGCTSLVEIPSSIEHLSSLKNLSLGSDDCCSRDFRIDEGQSLVQHHESLGLVASIFDGGALKGLANLEVLEICDIGLIEVPESIGLLIRLKVLNMKCCQTLEYLPNSIGDLKLLIRLELMNCHRLRKLPKTLGALARMKCLIITECWAITKLPRSIGLLSQLEYIWLSHCTSLKKLPTSMRQLESLESLEIVECGSIEAMGVLRTLQGLRIWGTTSTTKLPPSMSQVSHLTVRDSLEWTIRTSEGFEGPLCYSLYDLTSFSSSYEVLEEDTSGLLAAYYDEDELKKVSSLVRFKPCREVLES